MKEKWDFVITSFATKNLTLNMLYQSVRFYVIVQQHHLYEGHHCWCGLIPYVHTMKVQYPDLPQFTKTITLIIYWLRECGHVE